MTDKTLTLKVPQFDRRDFLRMTGASALALGTFSAGRYAYADGHELVRSHGYSFFGDLMYPADFAHFDYVNPDAPKGGEIAQWAQGSFDSFNQYARDGVSAALNDAL